MPVQWYRRDLLDARLRLQFSTRVLAASLAFRVHCQCELKTGGRMRGNLRLLFVVAVVGAGCGDPIDPVATHFLNGDFEEASEDGRPAHWTIGPGAVWGQDVLFDTTRVYSGAQSLFTRAWNSPHVDLTSAPFAVQGGRTYSIVVAYWLRDSSTNSAPVSVGMKWLYADGSMVTTDGTFAPQFPPVGTWNILADSYLAPTEAAAAQLLIVKSAEAAIAFDGAAVTLNTGTSG